MMPDKSITVSIIVPCYNVEAYIDECVRSLLTQQYVDYEILLIDDGSTDSTGAIVDSYSDDPRIRVFHKENGGLSSARNFGVDEARGKYITFVDGDDVVAPCYLQCLASDIDGSDGRMVIAGLESIKPEEANKITNRHSFEPFVELSKAEATRMVLTNRIGTTACGRLAPRKLYVENRFPEGAKYEEIRTIGAFIANTDSFFVSSSKLYGYVMRTGGIVRSANATLDQVAEYREAIEIAANTLLEVDPSLTRERDFFTAHFMTRSHDLLSKVKNKTADGKVMEADTRREVRRRLLSVIRETTVSPAKRGRIVMYALVPSVYDWIYAFFNKMVKGI